MAKLPQNFVTFNNTEYSVCNIKNQIIVTGGRTKQNDVWIYQVKNVRCQKQKSFFCLIHKKRLFWSRNRHKCVVGQSSFTLENKSLILNFQERIHGGVFTYKSNMNLWKFQVSSVYATLKTFFQLNFVRRIFMAIQKANFRTRPSWIDLSPSLFMLHLTKAWNPAN